MSKSLVIVESPAKGKTIEKYLGQDYQVMASYGHVRDLIPKEGAVDPGQNFAMKYEVIERNEKHVDAIVKALKKCDQLLLATDPDREGEAISWHLIEILRDAGMLEGKRVARVVFYEITKKAIRAAVDSPREISNDLVNAQQARRALDYLVGFNLSPLLWKKIKFGLSAGRVQSPALRMIVEREEEIEKFVSQEYWTIAAQADKDSQGFQAKLTQLRGEKVKQFTITDEQTAKEAQSHLLQSAQGQLLVGKVERKQRKRNPAPPFTTSTMQQEAVRKLGFSAQKAMRVAQQLYEGVDTGSGSVGLITYMRTDSVTLSNEALEELRSLISQRYGADNVPEKPNFYKTKSKNAQEAHEAIRPTSAMRLPSQIKSFLSSDQYKLYNLIWQRTVACQMIHATLDMVAVDLLCGQDNTFRANGSMVKYPGFMQVYKEDVDDAKKAEDDNRMLPPLVEGEQVPLRDIMLDQHFTEPPPRYTEASLVKSLEEYGIGRPSTYATIISTLLGRGYVELEQRRFTPTDVGRVVVRFLANHFTQYVNYEFTANLEDQLDAVSRGEKEWVPLMHSFWDPFSRLVEEKAESVTREEAVQARELGTDPESGRPMSVRLGRFGPFVQIGTKEDEEKPKFAGLRPGQKMDTITMEEALELFKLPRELGESPEGEKISVNIGRFGPYVKYDSKYASLKKEDDPYTVTLERALEIVAAKKEADANRLVKVFEGTEIQILNGRWGPYITDGNKNAKIPKELKEKPLEITLEQAEKWLEEAPEKRSKKKASAKKTAEKKTAAKKTSAKKTAAKKTASKKKASAKRATPVATSSIVKVVASRSGSEDEVPF